LGTSGLKSYDKQAADSKSVLKILRIHELESLGGIQNIAMKFRTTGLEPLPLHTIYIKIS